MLKNNKSLGQHWLKNRAILEEIADLVVTPPHVADICLEIGPGLGTLTSSLLRRFPHVIAVEYDPRLAANLPKSFPGKSLQVVNADILQVDIPELLSAHSSDAPPSQTSSTRPTPLTHLVSSAHSAQPAPPSPSPHPTPSTHPAPTPTYVVAGNIPYYITSPIIKLLLAATPRPRRIVLLVQKEVAERIAAEPGSLSPLALHVQNLAEVKLGSIVPAAEFTPPPKVDSRILILDPLPAPIVDLAVLDFARLGFVAPRKKLAANLAAAPRQKISTLAATQRHQGSIVDTPPATHHGQYDKTYWRTRLAELSLNPDARAEDLNLRNWEALLNSIS